MYNLQFSIDYYTYTSKSIIQTTPTTCWKKLKPVAMYSDWNNIDNFNNFSESPKGKIT